MVETGPYNGVYCRGNRVRPISGAIRSQGDYPDNIQFNSKTINESMEDFDIIGKGFNRAIDYSSYFYDYVADDSKTVRWSNRQESAEKQFVWTTIILVRTPTRVLRGVGCSDDLKIARQQAMYFVLTAVQAKPIESNQENKTEVQMDCVTKLGPQGEETQSSDHATSTIMTADQQVNKSDVSATLGNSLVESASSEPVAKFPQVTNRWMPLGTYELSDADTTLTTIIRKSLPVTMYAQGVNAPNVLPYRTYVYSRNTFTVRVMVNANKFQCGKIMISVVHNPYNMIRSVADSTLNALYRRNVIIDLAGNNVAEMQVPFRFHRSMIRNVLGTKANAGVTTAYSCDVQVNVLSPIRTGASQAVNLNVRMFYKIDDTSFAGISYAVVPEAQMDKLIGGLSQMAVGYVESQFKQRGKSYNQDKPSMLGCVPVVPRARLGFSNGKGMVDCVKLGNDPSVLTSFLPDHMYEEEPRSFKEVAQIWGLFAKFQWGVGDPANKVLFNFPINPTMSESQFPPNLFTIPMPITYASNCFNYWRGSIDLRFDFVSTSFHTGTVLIAVEFNRPTTDDDNQDSYSTYTKVFHLGEQKSVSFTVPYIYDTIERRKTLPPMSLLTQTDVAATDDMRINSLHVMPTVYTSVKMRIINALRAVSTVSQDIQVLAWMRGGKNFQMRSLCQNSFEVIGSVNRPTLVLGQFPLVRYSIDEDVNIRLPVVQMDRVVNDLTSDINDTDETATFNESILSECQSIDDETQFLDILRRPVLLIANLAVKASAGVNIRSALLLPLMPPGIDLCRTRGPNTVGDVPEPFYLGIANTPQCAVLAMFRQWRGSMRYTVIVHRSSGSPIYITKIPKSGARRFGVIDAGFGSNVDAFIYGTGCPTDMILPSVNPSLTIECPFDSETDFLMMNGGMRAPGIKYRDAGDYNGGHLALQSREDFVVDIWWSAGDDFMITNFIGAPYCFTNLVNYSMSDDVDNKGYRLNPVYNASKTLYKGDNRRSGFPGTLPAPSKVDSTEALAKKLEKKIAEKKAKDAAEKKATEATVVTQMDKVTEVASELRELATSVNPRVLAKGIVASIPVVGVGMAVAPLMVEASDALSSVKIASEKTSSQISMLATKFGVTIDALTAQLAPLVEKISSFAGAVVEAASIGGLVMNLLIDMLIGVVTQSWLAVAISVVRTIASYFGTTLCSKLMELAAKLSSYLSVLLGVTSQVETSFDSWSFAGLVASIVGTIVGVVIDPRNVATSWWRALSIRLSSTSGISYFNYVIKLFKEIFQGVYDYVLYALGYVSPEAEAVLMLKDKTGVLSDFVKESQLLTSEVNRGMYSNPVFRGRYWRNVMQAMMIQRVMCRVPNNLVSPIVVRMCSDVIKHANEQNGILKGFPVKWEPYVLCLEGASGIGKSYMVEELAMSLMKDLGYTKQVPTIVYYLNNGNDYWCGFDDQPVVCFDEWMNTNDPTLINKLVTTMFDLKSKKIFVPPQAEMEKKRETVNSFLVIICTNNAFPDNLLKTVMPDPKIIYRRRDMVLKVDLKPEYVGKDLRSEPSEVMDSFGHLLFSKYMDSTKASSLSLKKLEFAEMRAHLSKKFLRYSAQEKRNVNMRMSKLQELVAGMEPGTLNISDPFSLFYLAQDTISSLPTGHSSSMLPVERLNFEVEKLVHSFDQAISLFDADVTVPESGQDPFAPVIQAEDEPYYNIVDPVLSIWFSPILQAVGKGYNRLIAWIRSFVVQEVNHTTCCVCHTRTDIRVACRQTVSRWRNLDSPLHAVCVGCWDQIVLVGNKSCPMCRSTDMTVALPRELLVVVGGWYSLYQQGLVALSSFLNFINENICGKYLNVTTLECLFRAVELYVGQPPGAVFAKVVVSQLYCAIFDNYVDVFSQSDDEWEEPEAEPNEQQAGFGIDDIIVPVVDDNKIARYYETKERIVRRCPHSVVLQYTAGIRYANNKWKVALPALGLLEFEDVLCSGNCFWDNAAQRKLFFQQYVSQQIGQIKRKLLQMYNGDDTELSIPPCIVPDWLIGPDLEIENVTSQNWFSFIFGICGNIARFLITWKGMLTICGVFTTVFAITQYATVKDLLFSQSNPDYDEDWVRHFRPNRRVANASRRAPREGVRSQVDNDQFDDILAKIKRNFVCFELFDEHNDLRSKMNAVGVYEHTILIPSHYKNRLLSWPHRIILRSNHQSRKALSLEFKPTEACFSVAQMADVALMYLPRTWPLFVNIRKYFYSSQSLAKGVPKDAKIIVPPTRENPEIQIVDIFVSSLVDKIEFLDPSSNELISSTGVVEYNYSLTGACSALVVDPNSATPIYGFHVAGSGFKLNGRGYGVLLAQETFMDLTDAQMDFVDYQQPIIDSQFPTFVMDQNVCVEYLGSVAREKRPFTPNKSQIRPSLIQDRMGQIVRWPAILSKNDPRYTYDQSPLYYGICKHGQLTGVIPLELEMQLSEYLRLFMQSKFQLIVPSATRFGVSEAIVGIPNNVYYQPMDLSTSVGFPWSATFYKSKKDWCEVIETYDDLRLKRVVLKSDIMEVVLQKEELRKRGIVPATIFVDTLKDEKRSLEKIMKKGGTRVFCASPFDFTIALRQNFMHLFSSIMSGRINNSIGLGLAVDGPDWGRLVRVLQAKDHTHIINLDYSNFGPGYNCQLGLIAWEQMCNWVLNNVTGIDVTEVMTMGYELSHSMHLAGGLVYRQFAGSPSGSPDTTPKNCLVNWLHIMLAWIILANKHDVSKANLDNFLAEVALVVYGDDLIASVNAEIVKWFNNVSISQVLKEFNIKVTPANKDDEIQESVTLHEAQFLKRSFRNHPKFPLEWLAPIDKASIYSAAQWIWQCADKHSATRENAKAALELAYGHGPEFYKDFSNKLNKSLIQVKVEPLYLTWDDLDKLFFPDYYC